MHLAIFLGQASRISRKLDQGFLHFGNLGNRQGRSRTVCYAINGLSASLLLNLLFWPQVALAQDGNTFIFDESGVTANTPLSKKLFYEDGYSDQKIASVFSDLEVYDRENCDGYDNRCIIMRGYDAVLEIYPNSVGGILHIFGGVGSTDARGMQIGDSVVGAAETKGLVCGFGKWVTCLNPEQPAVVFVR